MPKQVKGFATAGQNRHTPDGVRIIGKPDFLDVLASVINDFFCAFLSINEMEISIIIL